MTVEAPDFERIEHGSFRAIADACNLFWLTINDVDASQRKGVRAAVERLEPKTLITSPSVSQNNLDTGNGVFLRFDGSSAINVTGIKARVEGSIVIVLVLGSATVTLKNNSASSDARNRLLFESGADVAVTTNQAVMLAYQNARWRELKWA